MYVRTGNGLMTSGWESRLGSSWPEAQYRVLQLSYQAPVPKSAVEAYTER